LRFNSRKLLEKIYLGIGVKKIDDVFNAIDKFEKLGEEKTIDYLIDDFKVNEDLAKKIVNIIKSTSIDDLKKKVSEINPNPDKPIDIKNELQEITRLIDLCKFYGIQDWIKLDFTVARGLVYYTGIVFEAYAKSVDIKRAICGGGRYDKILSTLGSKKNVAACGFGMGDVVLMEILQEKKLIPKIDRTVDICIFSFDKTLYGETCQITTLLRTKYSVELIMKKMKVKDCFAYASNINATKSVFIAPDEFKKGTVQVKDMRTKKKEEMIISKLLNNIF